MDGTMIDRMARADAAFCNRDFDAFSAADKKRFRARAAFILEVMREPTLAMRKACSFEAAEVHWPAMIDAALIAQDNGGE